MLIATRTFTSSNGEHFVAGRDRISEDHPLASAHPDSFRPAPDFAPALLNRTRLPGGQVVAEHDAGLERELPVRSERMAELEREPDHRFESAEARRERLFWAEPKGSLPSRMSRPIHFSIPSELDAARAEDELAHIRREWGDGPYSPSAPMSAEALAAEVPFDSAAGAEREQLALHEAAHAACAHLLGRPVGAIRLSESAGSAEVGLLPAAEATTDSALDEIALLLIGGVVARGLPASLPRESDDEHRAGAIALRASDGADEASALVEVGRARARSIAALPRFVVGVAALSRALVVRGS